MVVFGLFPGILLDTIDGSVASALDAAAAGTSIAIDPLVVAIGLGLVAAAVVIRVVTLPFGARSAAAESGS